MKDFLQKLKKFLKIAVIVVIVIFVAVGLVTAFDNHQRKVANTIDEEIGFRCNVEGETGYIRFILASTPNSRETGGYFVGGYIVRVQKSEIDDTYLTILSDIKIRERNIDYIYLSNGPDDNLKLNRKNLVLSLLDFKGLYEDKDYEVLEDLQCEEIKAQQIRDHVKETNAKAEAANKI